MEFAIQAAHIARFCGGFRTSRRLLHIGDIPEKSNWIDREFDDAFSLILSGRGHLYVAGREIKSRRRA